ncbi:MAG: hypothetical protein K8U57_32900, partial [Planctomycetes bacterium]|nr:hypothetical protein [Planctomycetota bacterium]
MRFFRPFLFLVLSMTLAASRSSADDRLPIPSAESVKKADEVIKGLFKDEYAKAKTKAPVKLTLAAMLLKQAGEAKDDAASKYVLLCEARELSAKGGDPDLAAKAAADLAAQFKISPGEALIPIADTLTSGATTLVSLQA